MLHEQALQAGQAVDRRQPDVPRQPDRPDIVGEQAVQPVGHRHQCDIVGPPPAFVARQRRERAIVEAEPPVVDHDLGQRRDIAQSEIEALAGDRMDGVGGVADQGEAAVDIAVGMEQPNRIAPAPAQDPHGAVPIAETTLHFRAERRIGQPQHGRRMFCPLRPDNGRAMGAVRRIGHRQDGERARGQEPLMGNAVMRRFVPHGADDAVLGIAPLGGGDPGLGAQEGICPVRSDDQRRGQNRPVLQCQFGDRIARGQTLRPGRRQDANFGRSLQQRRQPLADGAVLHDPAERSAVQRLTEIPVVVVQEQRRRAIGNADVQDRLGRVLDLPPQADLSQQPVGRIGDRRGPSVIGHCGHRRQRRPVDQRNRKPALRQGQRQGAADHAAADDDDIGRCFSPV